MIYIASPYSHTNQRVREDRAYQVGVFAATQARLGHIVYSPIASWHHLAVEHKLPEDFEFWRRLNLHFLAQARELWVLCLNGVELSKGVRAEEDFARSLHMLIRYFHGETFQELSDGDHPQD